MYGTHEQLARLASRTRRAGFRATARAVNPGQAKLRLDPLRSRLDRRRVVAIRRLTACGVPYAEPLG